MGNIVFLQPPAAKAELIAATTDPLQTLGKVCRTFEGELSNRDVSEDKVAHYLKQLQNTALQGPLEMVSQVWLLRDVTRSFQQQITRYRIGTSFNVESLRFAEKREARVLDTTGGNPAYRAGVQHAMDCYWLLLDSGVPAEDARGLLPLNICSDLFASISFRTLINMYEQRLCLQAQKGEWQPLLLSMRKQLPAGLADLLRLSCEGENYRCIFHSGWDRPCARRKSEIRKETTC